MWPDWLDVMLAIRWGSSMSNIEVGRFILEYQAEIDVIQSVLYPTTAATLAAIQLFDSDQEFYCGAARAEMKQFYDNYAAHVTKLQLLLTVAQRRLQAVLDSFSAADREAAEQRWEEEQAKSTPEGER
jgi:hypothetical protein